MSFTSIVKNEIINLEVNKLSKISELSALIKNTGIYRENIKITTENVGVARRIFSMVKDLYNISSKITVRKGYNFNKNYIYILEINSKVEKIITDLNLDKNIPDNYLIDDEELKRSYLRGLFLACGSINDPKKSRYHLEFLVSNREYAEVINILLNSFYLNSKILKRENKYMIYLKEAEKIGDFLRIINAINALFYYEDIRIYRDHKNMTNRLNNCEQANVDKIIATAASQVRDIEIINSIKGLNLLDDKTREAAIYRLKYKEASLTELSEIITLETGHSITKSGLHHRFNKIKNMADKIRENSN